MSRLSLLVSASAVAMVISSAALASNNTVNLWQTGTDQDADISQTGTYGTVNLEQGDGAGSGGNEANITQSGDSNIIGSAYHATQSGTDNLANIVQEGVHGTIELWQQGDRNGGQPTWWTNGAPASIWQDATAYYSTIKLTEVSNDALFNLAQGGSNNLIDVTQGGGNAETQAVQADTASYSTITVNQTNGGIPGANAWTYVWLQQAGGSSNNINALQNGFHLGLDVFQVGSNNTFLSSQTGFDNYAGLTAGAQDDLFIYQTGDWNYITNNQSGSFNVANGSQTGYANQVLNYQSGTNGSLLFTQSEAVSSGNYIYNSQSGDQNQAVLYQQGNGNSITNNQSGVGGIELLTAVQLGDGNTLSSSQSGGPQTAWTLQSGTGNAITGAQSGSANGATVSQIGNYNVATYSQAGTGGVASITQN